MLFMGVADAPVLLSITAAFIISGIAISKSSLTAAIGVAQDGVRVKVCCGGGKVVYIAGAGRGVVLREYG
jgi:hypothetical protein